MRGKVNRGATPRVCGRITPAYAGKSVKKSQPFSARQDHPRLCGEKSTLSQRFFRKTGSPPPMRGKDRSIRRFFPKSRITPAYAGKSTLSRRVDKHNKDHPRLCGEKPDWDGLDKTAQGSPPPMRGKVFIMLARSYFFRITPAYAGKSPAFVCDF